MRLRGLLSGAHQKIDSAGVRVARVYSFAWVGAKDRPSRAEPSLPRVDPVIEPVGEGGAGRIPARNAQSRFTWSPGAQT